MEEKGIALRELSCRNAAELPPPELPEYNPFLLHVAVRYGLQRVKARVPFPQFFSTMAEITPTRGLYYVEVPQTSDAVFMIHSIIQGAHSFWP